jgi:IclR family mhp operon transcriptional activator
MTNVVEPIVRALSILNPMNLHQQTTIQQLSKTTAMPKSTIHRLLNTLIAAGYIRKDSTIGSYSLTAKGQ